MKLTTTLSSVNEIYRNLVRQTQFNQAQDERGVYAESIAIFNKIYY